MYTDADLFKRTVCFSFSNIWQRKSCTGYGLGDYHSGQLGRYDLFISFPAFHRGHAAGGEEVEGLERAMGEKKRRVGEGNREKQDLYPDGNVETRVGAAAGKERPQ